MAKRLRHRMSLPEVLLWRMLKGRQLDGLHFRRQHPLGPYVLDFYCDAAKLCVEVDGYVHGTGAYLHRDPRRDAWLASQGVRTLRISAELVLQSADDAVRTIRQALELTLPTEEEDRA
jgi:very-short-patch-repair endonuclease